jgi:hypothetical protein
VCAGPSGVAERAGFEPATDLSARTRFPVALLRPLGHLSERGRVSAPALGISRSASRFPSTTRGGPHGQAVDRLVARHLQAGALPWAITSGPDGNLGSPSSWATLGRSRPTARSRSIRFRTPAASPGSPRLLPVTRCGSRRTTPASSARSASTGPSARVLECRLLPVRGRRRARREHVVRVGDSDEIGRVNIAPRRLHRRLHRRLRSRRRSASCRT